MNTIDGFQTPGIGNQPLDNVTALVGEFAGMALRRLEGGQLGPGNQVNGVDQVHCDMCGPSAGVPNFGSWAAPEGGEAAPGGASPWGNVAAAGGPGGAAGANGLPVGPAAQGSTSWGPEDEKFLDQAVSGAGGGGGDLGGGASSSVGDMPGGGAGEAEDSPGAAAPAGGGGEATGVGTGAGKSLFDEFGQTNQANCASVAVIKAALDKYKGKVFTRVQKTGQGYQVTKQDGSTVTISKDELKQAAGAAAFKGQPSADKSMAVLMFAVIAKAEGGNFQQALQKLDHGFDPKKAAKDLGLGNKIRDVNPGQANGPVVAWSGAHAVFEDGGKKDNYGKALAADGTDGVGHKLEHAFTFV